MFKNLFSKYKSVIFYVVFGVFTTLVNILTYYIMAHVLNLSTTISTIIAWILAVLFAYLTNRKLVFNSDSKNANDVIKELISFYVCRLITGFIDLACMFVFVDLLSFNDIIIKVMANVLVVVLNYVASKLIIFRKK